MNRAAQQDWASGRVSDYRSSAVAERASGWYPQRAVMADPPQRKSEESLIALTGILVTKQGLEKTLRQVLDLACAALPGGNEGGVTLLGAEEPQTAAATSDAALRVDRIQYASESGGPVRPRRHPAPFPRMGRAGS